MNAREAIESFHLFFLNRLTAKVDRSLYCLKGGCNLRFYFRSIRYSEDIDFDVRTIATSTLKKNIDKILTDPVFKSMLKHQFLEIVDWSAPKQTETTQRWKILLKLGSQNLNLPTKIEFSRRKKRFDHAQIEYVDPHLITNYKLQPVLLQHYLLPSAVLQKIHALVHRSETQARDVIDLKILKDQCEKPFICSLSKKEKEQALQNLSSISFDDFKSQVWPFLMTEYQSYYEHKSTWQNLQDEIFNFIEKQDKLT